MVTARPDLAPDPAGNDEDLALIRQLAALPPLPVPPGLTSRIVRDVPRLAQLPAQGRVAGRAAGWSRWLGPVASLAAGVAVFALILPRGAPVAAVSVPARAVTMARPVAVPPADAPVAARAAPLADATVRAAPLRQRPGLRRAVVPQADAQAPVLAIESAAPAPAVQTAAASVVSAAAAGPVDLAAQTAGPAATGPLGARTGLMGPTLPQGYGFAGAAGAARGEFGTPAGPGIPAVGPAVGPAIGPGGRPH